MTVSTRQANRSERMRAPARVIDAVRITMQESPR